MNQDGKDYGSNLKEVDFLIKGQYQSVIFKVAINIFVTVVCIVMIGIFMGIQSLLSFLLGLNLVGIYICFNSLIIGYSVKNAREYNRNYGKVIDVDEAAIQSDITVSTTEGIPGTTLLPYLIFSTLFVLQGATKWGKYGYFREWVGAGLFNQLASSATAPVLEIITNTFDGTDETPTVATKP